MSNENVLLLDEIKGKMDEVLDNALDYENVGGGRIYHRVRELCLDLIRVVECEKERVSGGGLVV